MSRTFDLMTGYMCMKAKDVMTSPVASLEPDATVLQAVHMMLQKRISGLLRIPEKTELMWQTGNLADTRKGRP